MRVLIFTDNHFCASSSILRQRGKKYTLRLENQIESLNWLEELAIKENCDEVICLGDFFDKPTLTDEELTALKDIRWNNLDHYFIVGNHESSINGLAFNSTKALERPNFTIVSEPSRVIDTDGLELDFLPYIIESDRKPLWEYYPKCEFTKRRIIFSHNDIKGIQMGPVISKDGFEIMDIENNCDLCINGHLHNGVKISNKIINLGNLTGQNFSEDANRYSHNVMILDTDTLQYKLIENPYAFNFYKISISKYGDFQEIKNNAVLSITASSSINKDDLIKQFDADKHIITYRLTTVQEMGQECSLDINELHVDHLAKFVEFCKANIDNTNVLDLELNEVCK